MANRARELNVHGGYMRGRSSVMQFCDIRLRLLLVAVSTVTARADTALQPGPSPAKSAAVMTRPGLIADAQKREITLSARATGLGAKDIVEFFIVSEHSSHDYEALATTAVKPSDLQAALVHIGMQPGIAVNPQRMRYWSKGERVMLTVEAEDGSLPVRPIESLVIDNNRPTTMPTNGFIFCALKRETDGEEAGTFPADFRDPGSIVSTYNEPTTLLDVPRKAPKGEVYQSILVNPRYVLVKDTALTIKITPERAVDDPPRVRGFTLSVDGGDQTSDLPGARVQLCGSDGEPACKPGLKTALQALRSVVESGQDPYLQLRLGEDAPLRALEALAKTIEQTEGEEGIRMEPPSKEDLYYKAFLPRESFRNREDRLEQPWELVLQKRETEIVASLTQVKEHWESGRIRPRLEVIEHPLNTPAELDGKIADLGGGIPVILCFADAEITYGELMKILVPVRERCPVIYVYANRNN